MTVYLGNYNIPTDDAPYVRQRDAIIDAIKTFGADHVTGITVGNEYMLKCVSRLAFLLSHLTVFLATSMQMAHLTRTVPLVMPVRPC